MSLKSQQTVPIVTLPCKVVFASIAVQEWGGTKEKLISIRQKYQFLLQLLVNK